MVIKKIVASCQLPVAGRQARKKERGFTLIELLVVVTIIGLLAGIAVLQVRQAQRKAAENVLRGSLAVMRQAIDTYYADKQKYPDSLQGLVPNYMRAIPRDPITKSADSWIEAFDEPDLSDPDSFDFSTDFDEESLAPGVVDVRSGAEGETLDGTPYGDL